MVVRFVLRRASVKPAASKPQAGASDGSDDDYADDPRPPEIGTNALRRIHWPTMGLHHNVPADPTSTSDDNTSPSSLSSSMTASASSIEQKSDIEFPGTLSLPRVPSAQSFSGTFQSGNNDRNSNRRSSSRVQSPGPPEITDAQRHHAGFFQRSHFCFYNDAARRLIYVQNGHREQQRVLDSGVANSNANNSTGSHGSESAKCYQHHDDIVVSAVSLRYWHTNARAPLLADNVNANANAKAKADADANDLALVELRNAAEEGRLGFVSERVPFKHGWPDCCHPPPGKPRMTASCLVAPVTERHQLLQLQGFDDGHAEIRL